MSPVKPGTPRETAAIGRGLSTSGTSGEAYGAGRGNLGALLSQDTVGFKAGFHLAPCRDAMLVAGGAAQCLPAPPQALPVLWLGHQALWPPRGRQWISCPSSTLPQLYLFVF